MVWRTRYVDASRRVSRAVASTLPPAMFPLLVACWIASVRAQPATPILSDATPTPRIHPDRHIELVTRFIPEDGFRAGEPLRFEVAVQWLDLGENISTRLAEPPTFENLDIISTSTRNSTRNTDEGRRVEEVYSFVLVPREEGPARAGAVQVTYGPGGEEEGRLSSVARDITVGPPSGSVRILVVGIAAAVVVLVVGGLAVIWLLLRSRRKKPPPKETEPERPFEQTLADARRWRLEGDMGRYYAALERAVRQALSNRFAYGDADRFSAKELPPEVDGETRRLIESFFTRCTEGKYAPAKPTTEELDRIWEDANQLLRLG